MVIQMLVYTVLDRVVYRVSAHEADAHGNAWTHMAQGEIPLGGSDPEDRWDVFDAVLARLQADVGTPGTRPPF